MDIIEKKKKAKELVDQRRRQLRNKFQILNDAATGALTSSYNNDQIKILQSRVDRLERNFINLTSFSLSTFAFELFLSLLTGPVASFIIAPQVDKLFKSISNGRLSVPRKVDEIIKSHVLFIGNIDYSTLSSTKKIGLINLLDDLLGVFQSAPAYAKKLIDERAKVINISKKLTEDTLNKAIEKIFSEIVKGQSSNKSNQSDAVQADGFDLTQQVLFNMQTKLSGYVDIIDKQYKELDEAIQSRFEGYLINPTPTDLEKINKEYDELIKFYSGLIDEHTKEFELIEEAQLKTEWVAYLRMIIWIMVIGKGSNIGDFVVETTRFRPSSTSQGDGDIYVEKEVVRSGYNRPESSRNIGIIKYIQLKIDTDTVHQLIQSLPSKDDSFLKRAINIRKRVKQSKVDENNLRPEYIIAHPKYGMVPDTGDIGPVLSVRDIAVQLLMRWVDDISKKLQQDGDHFAREINRIIGKQRP